MIGTHTAKLLNARLKQTAVRARIAGQVPAHLVCSQTTHLQREAWAMPRNAAEMATYRLEALEARIERLPAQLPDIEDPRLKQLLLPLADWRSDGYLCVTPVASGGLMHELWNRLHDQRLPHRTWIVQPTPAAMANHGEALLLQSGKVRLLTRGAPEPEQGNWRGDYVLLQAHAERLNISSGMVAVGWPAITAIGGLVHAIERASGLDIEFAFGMRDSQWVPGGPRLNNERRSGLKVQPTPGYSTEEITSNARVFLLLQAPDLDALLPHLQGVTRLAGGALFDIETSLHLDAEAPSAAYLRDIPATRMPSGTDGDALQQALKCYAYGVEWKGGKWWQKDRSHTLNMTGYALLEEPKLRSGAREHYPHAWTEPVFATVEIGAPGRSMWWRRHCHDWGVHWANAPHM